MQYLYVLLKLGINPIIIDSNNNSVVPKEDCEMYYDNINRFDYQIIKNIKNTNLELGSFGMPFGGTMANGRFLYGYSAVPIENEKMEIEITLNNDSDTGYDFGTLDTCSANLYVTLKLNDIQYYNNESIINPLIDINKVNGMVNTDITSSLCEKITFIDDKLANTFYMSDIYPNFAVEISDVLLPNGLSYSLTNINTNFDQNNFIYGLNVLGNVSNACSGIASGNIIAYNTIDGNKIQITNPAPFSFNYEFINETIIIITNGTKSETEQNTWNINETCYVRRKILYAKTNILY